MGRRKKRDEWDAADKLKAVKEYLAGKTAGREQDAESQSRKAANGD